MPPEGSNQHISKSSVQRGGQATHDEERFVLKDFSDLAEGELRKDSEFRRALLCEAIETFLENDHVTAQLMLRDYVNATLGFAELGRRVGKSPKSLMRMLSASGNPRVDNLFAILHSLMAHEGIEIELRAVDAA